MKKYVKLVLARISIKQFVLYYYYYYNINIITLIIPVITPYPISRLVLHNMNTRYFW